MATKETKERLKKAGGKCTPKEKKFSKEYVKTLNQTQAALTAYGTDKPNVASQIAQENLLKPRVRQEIERLLSENDIDIETILNIHKRNLLQDKHIATSQKAVNDFYELLGLKDQPDTTKVNIAFVVEN